MSMLLIHEPPVQYLSSLAALIGVDQAIILQQTHYWLHDYSESEYIKGVAWIDRLYYRCCEKFSSWDEGRAWTIVDNLINSGHIIAVEFKGKGKLFTIDYDHLKRENE